VQNKRYMSVDVSQLSSILRHVYTFIDLYIYERYYYNLAVDFAIPDVSPSLRKRNRSPQTVSIRLCAADNIRNGALCVTRTIHADNKISTKVNFCLCVLSLMTFWTERENALELHVRLTLLRGKVFVCLRDRSANILRAPWLIFSHFNKTSFFIKILNNN